MMGQALGHAVVQKSAVFVQHQVVGVAVQLLEGEEGGVAGMDLVDGRGEGGEGRHGRGLVHGGGEGVAEGLYGEFTGVGCHVSSLAWRN